MKINKGWCTVPDLKGFLVLYVGYYDVFQYGWQSPSGLPPPWILQEVYINSSSTNSGLLEIVCYSKRGQFQLNPFNGSWFNDGLVRSKSICRIVSTCCWESSLHIPKCESPANVVPNITKLHGKLLLFHDSNSTYPRCPGKCFKKIWLGWSKSHNSHGSWKTAKEKVVESHTAAALPISCMIWFQERGSGGGSNNKNHHPSFIIHSFIPSSLQYSKSSTRLSLFSRRNRDSKLWGWKWKCFRTCGVQSSTSLWSKAPEA